MFKDVRDIITPKNSEKVYNFFTNKQSLTVTQAELNILVGYSLQYTKNPEHIQNYLKYLPELQKVTIIGIPSSTATKILKN